MRRWLVLVVVLASACGQDEPVTPGPADLEGFDFSVDAMLAVDDDGFSPSELVVGIGDVIELRNDGDETHTITASSGQFDVRLLPGETSTVILEETGRTRVRDAQSPDNEASIVVESHDDEE